MKKTNLLRNVIGATTIATGMLMTTTAFAMQPTLKVEGNTINCEVAPQIVSGRLMVPVRDIFESVGANVSWDAETKTIHGVKEATTIDMRIGDGAYYLNGELNYMSDGLPLIIDGRTLAPARMVAETFGYNVDWDAGTKTVNISASTNQTTTETTTEATTEDYKKVMLELVNKEREAAGLEPLELKDRLCRAAQDHCEDMAKNNFFSHVSPTKGDITKRMRSFGVNTSQYYVLENCHAGEPSGNTSREIIQNVVNSWMNSTYHRAAILREDITALGVGQCNGYWTINFAGLCEYYLNPPEWAVEFWPEEYIIDEL